MHTQHRRMCHDRAALAGQEGWSVSRRGVREVNSEIDSSERESLCTGRAALGDEDALKINSPHAKEIVVAALTAAGREAGLKVRALSCMGAGTSHRTLDPERGKDNKPVDRMRPCAGLSWPSLSLQQGEGWSLLA